MSDITLQNVDALGDFLTNEVYEISVVRFPVGFSGISSDDINFRCSSITIPDTEVNHLTITHRTFTKYQPTHRVNGKDSITMNLIETMTPKTLPFLRDWANRCARKGTNYVYPPEQRQAELLIYHKKNNKEIAWIYNLKHCQIVNKGEIALNNGENPEAIIPALTFNCNLILEGPSIANLR